MGGVCVCACVWEKGFAAKLLHVGQRGKGYASHGSSAFDIISLWKPHYYSYRIPFHFFLATFDILQANFAIT